jgi:hypothetical protein
VESGGYQGKAGKKSRRLELQGGYWSDAHENIGDDLRQIWEGASYQPLNFPYTREDVTNFDYETTERRSSLLASDHLSRSTLCGKLKRLACDTVLSDGKISKMFVQA